MEFLKPKIIVKKDEEGNYLLKKKANILLILSLFELHPKSWTKIGGAVFCG